MHAHQGKTIEICSDFFPLRPFSKLGTPRKGQNANICTCIKGTLLKQIHCSDSFQLRPFSKLRTHLKDRTQIYVRTSREDY